MLLIQVVERQEAPAVAPAGRRNVLEAPAQDQQVRRALRWPFKRLKQTRGTGQAFVSRLSKPCSGLVVLWGKAKLGAKACSHSPGGHLQIPVLGRQEKAPKTLEAKCPS